MFRNCAISLGIWDDVKDAVVKINKKRQDLNKEIGKCKGAIKYMDALTLTMNR